MTFAATVNVIEHVGARPVLVDVEPDTLNLDPNLVARAITPRSRAIIPVHYGGHPANMDSIEAIAADHALSIVEDAAHALGAAYKGRLIGSADHPVAFSFYATKNLTTGEGGMLTGNSALLAQCRMLASHGIKRDVSPTLEKSRNWSYEVLTPGFKYNMADIQAAIGLCQLRKFSSFQKRRVEIAHKYQIAFAGQRAS